MINRIQTIVFYLVLLALWQIVFKLAIWPDFLFPAPMSVLETFRQGFADGSFLIGISISMSRVAKGYLIAIALGLPAGVLIARLNIFKNTIGTLISGLQPLPSICWLPLAVLWIGLNERAIIFIILIGATFSIATATEAGVRNVPPIFLRAAKTMGTKGWRIYTDILFPAALPSIMTGMKLAWAFAWRALMAGELLSSGVGLGQILMIGRDLNDMSMVIAVMIIIATLGQLIDRFIFCMVETKVRKRWGLDRA
ncbi:MAG: ABC transporter permease [Thermincola sp.]|jgi:NitT/TauT family transport system permease protein|nr:ABC transporter permease [Thermincola sp.]MDT3704965.1 ABC transporter permease [Thermincola sp.]